MKKNNKNAIYGLAVGDALGVPYEFLKRNSFSCTEMIGFGTHRQPEGTWSDDTSMTLAVSRSLKDNNGIVDIEDIKDNFLKWAYDGEFAIENNVFDIGNTTSSALFVGEPRTDARSNGNGSLMRTLPLAFTNCSNDDIRKVSAITHGHYISTESCVIYVHIARMLLEGKDIKKIIDYLKLPGHFYRLNKIYLLNEKDIKSDGYVVHTLESALWCLANSNSFEECVLKAVNLGGDTDTTAAVAGGLAGIVYGEEVTQSKMFKKLRGKDIIDINI